MTDEPLFPKPQGPEGPRPVLLNQPDGDGDSGGRKIEIPPLGADGFAQETTFTVDNSTPGSTIVVPERTTEVLETLPLLAGLAGFSDGRPAVLHSGLGWNSFDRNATVDEAVAGIFVMPFTKTFNRMTIFIANSGPPDNTVDLGIYNATRTARIVSTGPTAVGAGAYPPNRFTLSCPLTTLIGGTKYSQAMIWSRGTVGANLNYVAISYGSGAYVNIPGSGSTTSLSATYTAVGATLPAGDLAAAGAFGANGSCAPLMVLWRT